MTPEQFSRLLEVLEKLANKSSYTITGASDWPILAVVGAIIVALIGAMWSDLRGTIKENKAEAKSDINLLWAAQRDCQEDCCPRGSSKVREAPR